ncbi:hypothetical protein D3C79_707030 [compost metagenome]
MFITGLVIEEDRDAIIDDGKGGAQFPARYLACRLVINLVAHARRERIAKRGYQAIGLTATLYSHIAALVDVIQEIDAPLVCKTGLTFSPKIIAGVVRQHALVVKPESVNEEVGKAHGRKVLSLAVLGADSDEMVTIITEPGGIALDLLVDDSEKRRL